MPRSPNVAALAFLAIACGQPSRPPNWVSATSRDGSIALDLPAMYQREGSRDSWSASPNHEGTRRFGLWRAPAPMPDPGRPQGMPVPLGPWENGCGAAAQVTDVGCIVDRSQWRGKSDGRTFVIETGRLEGAMSPSRSVLAIHAEWLRAVGDTVGFDGAAADSAGLAELREIATSLRPAL
jgi:hypothetical protein